MEKRERAVVFIARELTDRQAARLITETIVTKSRIAPEGRGTVRKEHYMSVEEKSQRRIEKKQGIGLS